MAGFSVSFSESMSASYKVVVSPNGLFMAHIHNQEKLLIRDVQEGLKVSYTFNTRFRNYDQMEWSSDSLYIAVSSIGQALIQIYSMVNRKWKCKIDIGTQELGGVGLVDFSWNPNSRQILTTSSHYMQLTIWSLTEKQVHLIKDILPIKEYKSFSSDGKYFAVVKFNSIDVRRKFIEIYDTSDWRNRIRSVTCNAKDIYGVKWCPDGTLLVWDSQLYSNLYVYSFTGQLMKHYSPDGLSLGIQSIAPSPTGHFIAFTNHKHQLRLMNTASYGISLSETINECLISDFPDAQIYAEASEGSRKYRYKMAKEFQFGETGRANPSIEDSPKLFRTKIQFNWDGSLIAAHSMQLPHVLWIFDISTTKLISVLAQQHSISDFSWHPSRDRLSLVTRTDGLYFWSSEGCYAIQIPEENFRASSADWNPDGESILLTSGEKFTVCYFRQ